MGKDKKKARILLLYVSDISGHRQAARAIKQALNSFYPDVLIQEENLFRHGNPFVRCSLNSLYYTFIKVIPWFWDIIWDSKEVYWLTYALRIFLYYANYHRLYREVIKPFDPHAVICTHCLSCAISSTIKRAKKLNYSLVAVPTDFYLNPYWFYKNVDVYFLPHSELKADFIKRGISPEKIQITGIPISLDFCKLKQKEKLKKKWRIKDGLFTILVMGGGQGIGSIEETVLTLSEAHLPLQILAVTGINRKLKRKLQKISSQIDLPLKVLGYVNGIDELMEISDLLISKSGGLTTAEALSKALPMGIIDSIPGQERRNKQLLLKKNLAFELTNKKNIIDLIKKLSDHSFNREDWKERTKNLAYPRSSEEIARRVMELIKP